jgi:pantetheine-phosphate adenylyltransferase
MADRIAIFPGSFDPITLGHVEIIERALLLFDRVIVAIGINTSKSTMFPVEQREAWIRSCFADEPRVLIERFQGLTVAYARQHDARFLIRGLRGAPDFEYEKSIDQLNKHLDADIETLYLISNPATGHISSTLVREVIRFRGHLQGLVPPHIIHDLYQPPNE